LIEASSETLSKVIKKIQEKYKVPIEAIKAIILDHQLSTIKAIRETLPRVPHQYCNFNFLKNLNRNIEPFDSHLHIELVKYLNELSYYKYNFPYMDILINKNTYNSKNMILMILKDIIRLVNKRSRDFGFFFGFELYNDLKGFIKKIRKLRFLMINNNIIYEILLKIENMVKNTLNRNKSSIIM